MLEKLPLDILLKTLGYLELRDVASVDRTDVRLEFACAQIFLRDKEAQRRLSLLNSVLPCLRFGKKWSSPERMNALEKMGRYPNRRRGNPFEVPKNERVVKEKKNRRREARKTLDELLEKRPEDKLSLLKELWNCRNGKEHKGMDKTILCVWRAVLAAYEDVEDASLWVDNVLYHYEIYDELYGGCVFSDSDSD
nr:F-box containing protein [Marseillevirus futianmevirus]